MRHDKSKLKKEVDDKSEATKLKEFKNFLDKEENKLRWEQEEEARLKIKRLERKFLLRKSGFTKSSRERGQNPRKRKYSSEVTDKKTEINLLRKCPESLVHMAKITKLSTKEMEKQEAERIRRLPSKDRTRFLYSGKWESLTNILWKERVEEGLQLEQFTKEPGELLRQESRRQEEGQKVKGVHRDLAKAKREKQRHEASRLEGVSGGR